MEILIAALIVGAVIVVAVWVFDAVTGKAIDILFESLVPLFIPKSKKEYYLDLAIEVIAENWKERCDTGLSDADCRCQWCTILSAPSKDRRAFLTQFYVEMSECLPDGSIWQHWAFRKANSDARRLDARPRLDEHLRRVSRRMSRTDGDQSPRFPESSTTEKEPES